MRKPSLWTGVLGAAIALTMVARPAFAVQETKIGVTSASNRTATGFPPVSPEHLLEIGVEVVGDERVITTKDGRAQLLFLDHSGRPSFLQRRKSQRFWLPSISGYSSR